MPDLEPHPLAAQWSPPPSLRHSLEDGKRSRERRPRAALAELVTTGRDPMAILDGQDLSRVPELVPIRTERMGASAFAFYRGTAAIMASDLGRSPDSDLSVASCGDAHVSNFGLFASPQRTLAFDLNDFDEAAWAPWEWDLKRLVTSVVIAGQSASRDDAVVREAALATVRTYARALRRGVERTPLQRYYDHFDAGGAVEQADEETRKALKAAVRDAERRTGARAQKKLTTTTDGGRLVFVEAPPTMTHVDPAIQERALALVSDYVLSANVDIRAVMQNYTLSDLARRVVGVGSVGTRCYLLAMQDGNENGLILQAKEAGASVLVAFGKAKQPPVFDGYVARYGDGGRVVALQRILQAVSDPFLGHVFGTPAEGGAPRAFYIRQFHDKKGGFDVDALEDSSFTWYAHACAATLARAHSQSPNAATVSGYVGQGRVVGEAIAEWAYAYAELAHADWELFRLHRGIEAG